MRKALALSIILTVLAVIAYFTKPTETLCIQEAKEEFTQKKLSYTTETLPAGVDKKVFSETLEKSFLQSLQVEDHFVYRTIYQTGETTKTKIGWGAFGLVSVDIQ
jgi:hypothetical protein